MGNPMQASGSIKNLKFRENRENENKEQSTREQQRTENEENGPGPCEGTGRRK